MDYHRIYNEFIADRLTKQPVSGYFEKHHILPRSLGGSDDPSNLIKLTADDHLMAHMILAKVYGRGMWAALRAMMGISRNSRRAFTSKRIRLAYKLDRENFGASISELFEDSSFRAKHRAATAEATKTALNDPAVREKHVAAIREAHRRRGKQQIAHVKCYRSHARKLAASVAASERMKSFYSAGRLLGTKTYNPAQDENLKAGMAASQKQRYQAETAEQKKARSDAMHTDAAKARRLQTLQTSEKWAEFQARNRAKKPNQSGENHWRAKRRKAMEASAVA